MIQLEKTYQGWSWERVSRHILYWMAWLLFYVITNSAYHDYGIEQWTAVELLMMCIKLPVAYFTIYYLVPQFLLPKKYLPFLLSFFTLVIVGGLITWMMNFYILNVCVFNEASTHFWSPKIGYKVVDLIYISCVPTMIKMYQRQALAEKRATQLVGQKLGAELKVLKNQLHPHFLFNTLNNLYSMILTQHPKAADVVVKLSNMMSYMLYDCERPLIDLEKEIENLKNYIELEKIRYGKRLDISFETGGAVRGKLIAPLLLLPFFENAFKHGAEKNDQISWVRINIWIEGEELTFLLENSLPEKSEEENIPNLQSGVGLSNVKKRLELIYPDNYQLSVTHNETYLVKLNLNLSNEVPNR